MMEEPIRPVLNIVFDKWNEDTPIPNLLSQYPNKQLSDPSLLLLHYQNDATKEYKFITKKCHLEDVNDNTNENFYYFINHGGNHFSEFMVEYSNDNQISKRLDFLSNDIKKTLIKYKNFKIIILTEHEPDNEASFIILRDYIQEHQLNSEQFYVVNNNSLLPEYPKRHNTKINTHQLDFISHSSTKVLWFLGGCKFIKDKKGKFFMCFNKSPKKHRYALLCMLKKQNLLDEINWSLVPSWNAEPDKNFYLDIFDKFDLFKFENEIDYFKSIPIKRSDYEEDKGWFNQYQDINNSGFPIWLQIPEYMPNYESSYVNIVTESKFLDSENNIHISEKSFRPFFYYQFPLILASHNHIKKMKEKFKLDFFDDIINHSYDSQPNQRIRLEMFLNEIQRLNGNRNQLIEFYGKNYERFEENKRKVLDILKIVDKDYYFFESLI